MGSCENIFHGLDSCARDITKKDLEIRFPCSKFGALCTNHRESGISGRLCPFFIGRAFLVGNRTRSSPPGTGSQGYIIATPACIELVIASYSNRTVAHSVLTGTVPNNYCQSVGSDFTDVSPQKI